MKQAYQMEAEDSLVPYIAPRAVLEPKRKT